MPSVGELYELLSWYGVKIPDWSRRLAKWRRERADLLRILHDDHEIPFRSLAEDADMAHPSVIEAIERSRRRPAP